jgi:hypothetical protein
MDRVAVGAGSLVAALALLAALIGSGTPEAAILSLVGAGALTGAASRNFQSELLDGWAACTLGTVLAVVVLFGVLGATGAVNRITGNTYNFGIVVFFGAVAFSPVAGLLGAFGGRYGALLRRRLGTVRDAS